MITPVILSGGSGTRLWPLSRQSYPKQFVSMLGDKTLFQAAAQRMSGKIFDKPLVITNSDFRFIVTQQLQKIGIDPGPILIEPQARNTAPAVLAAALYLFEKNPKAVMLVAPSDHIIADNIAFQTVIQKGLLEIKKGRIVTFGITPTHAETAYGYLELDGENDDEATPLRRFIEKPTLIRAEEMIENGGFLWNAGIFLFNVTDIIDAFKVHAAALLSDVHQAVATIEIDIGFCRLGTAAWAEVDDISIDHAIMEKASNLSVVPFNSAWSDLGGWDAVWRSSEKDENGVNSSLNSTTIDCKNTLLRSESEDLQIVGIGLKNIVVVGMKDAILVADMSKSQEVKKVVGILQAQNAYQSTDNLKEYRPWGWFERLVIGDRFQVKRIHVEPGASLSLQSHQHRAEHWVVVSGTAQVTIDGNVELVSENQSVFIPLAAVHRVSNFGKVPMVLIEVQTGAYLGEDDIVRYEDVYARQ